MEFTTTKARAKGVNTLSTITRADKKGHEINRDSERSSTCLSLPMRLVWHAFLRVVS